MLSRTASELYWMARYLERAESIARVLDVTNKLSMMPIRDSEDHDLQVPLNLTGTGQLYAAAYPDLTMANLVSFFALDSRNHSSIYSCLQMGWNNAHAVRGSLSSEVWECINATWIEMKLIRRQGIGSVGTDAFFDWVKERSHLFRGAMFGTLLTLDHPHQAITIQAHGVVEIEDGVEDPAMGHLSPLVFLRHSPLTQPDSAIQAFALRYYQPEALLAGLEKLMGDLLLKMPYTPGATEVTDSAAQAFASGNGVCQDHTHVFLACCRSLNIPARYVSGYLYSEDSTHVATHAWAEAWVDERWHSFDVTNNTRLPNQHLKLAVGIDYLDACPVRGIRLGGGSEDMQTVAAVQMMPACQAQGQ